MADVEKAEVILVVLSGESSCGYYLDEECGKNGTKIIPNQEAQVLLDT